MKILITTLVCCTLFHLTSNADSQCFVTKKYLFVQKERDWLPFKDCKYFQSPLNIQGSSFKNLKIFSNLERVKSIEIRNNDDLVSFNGLEKLAQIDEYLVVDGDGSSKITDMNALRNLKQVGGNIKFGFMNGLLNDQSFKGFSLNQLKEIFKKTNFKMLSTFEKNKDELGTSVDEKIYRKK